MLTKGQVVTNNLIMAAQHKYTKRELDFLAKNNIVHIPMHKLVGLLTATHSLLIVACLIIVYYAKTVMVDYSYKSFSKCYQTMIMHTL